MYQQNSCCLVTIIKMEHENEGMNIIPMVL